MGYGSYSDSRATTYSAKLKTKSAGEIFSKGFNSAMNPFEVEMRESRDSVDHPESFPIIIALDVTGSMGSIPLFLIKEGLPTIMKKIMDAGIKDPQVLFMGVGDHTCDEAPLQVGQFESSDELLNKWLTEIWLEGRGGGNDGESYFLPWYFTKNVTTDHLEKRGKKGVLITIGDEPVLKEISESSLNKIVGGQNQKFTATEMLDMAEKKFEVFHLHMGNTKSGSRDDVRAGWKQLMSDNCVIVENRETVADRIVDVVINVFKSQHGTVKPVVTEKKEEVKIKL